MTTDLHETDDGAADPTDDAPVSFSQMRGAWTESVFGIVDEGRVRRRPTDIAQVVVAVALVAIAAAGASDLTSIERGLVDLLASFPGGLEPLWNMLFLLVPIVAGILIVVAVLARNLRLLGTQALAVGLAAIAAAALSSTVTVFPDWSDPSAVAHGHSPDFPVVWLTIGAAALWASWPYVTRPARRLLEAVLWLGALSAALLPEGLPGSVIASLVLAWGAAAVAHLCLGSPDATPSVGQVVGSLRELGVDATDLRLATEQSWGSTMYTAGSAGEVSIEVLGRDNADAHLLAKIWRFVWYKDSGPTLSLTRYRPSRARGVRALPRRSCRPGVPNLVAAGLAGGRDDSAIRRQEPAGRHPPFDGTVAPHRRGPRRRRGRTSAGSMEIGSRTATRGRGTS